MTKAPGAGVYVFKITALFTGEELSKAKAPGAGVYVFMIGALLVADPDDYSKGARCGRLCMYIN